MVQNRDLYVSSFFGVNLLNWSKREIISYNGLIFTLRHGNSITRIYNLNKGREKLLGD